MDDSKLQTRVPAKIKEKGQYLLVFGIIASMLVVANIPIFVVFFFGVFAYLVVKILFAGTRSETREIFEFYLASHEILKDDDRKWFGFEINEVILRGEGILQRMNAAPPLVYFTLGALYGKTGDHSSAVRYLSNVVEEKAVDESAYMYPSQELRNYVKVLRKIEREPADAPLTSSAVRSLERARRLRGAVLLESSRKKLAESKGKTALEQPSKHDVISALSEKSEHKLPDNVIDMTASSGKVRTSEQRKDDHHKYDPYADRKPITEVLHDIYDGKAQ
ncbi:MAG: hypothetical protein KF685_04345 [Acidobacteria bacterium]|nr:hypothetical protein [Acidobacteriota bacterium]